MYTSVLLLFAAMTVHHPHLALITGALVNAGFYLVKARYEEGLLVAAYEEYAAYRQRTWGVIPGF